MKTRYIALTVAVSLILMSVMGYLCKDKAKTYQALTILNKTYNTEFEIDNVKKINYLGTDLLIDAHPVDKKLPFRARVDIVKNSVESDYLENKLCAEMSKEFNREISDYERYVYTTLSPHTTTITEKSQSLEDLANELSNLDYNIYVWISPKERPDTNDLLHRLSNIISRYDIKGTLTLYTMDESMLEKCVEYIKTHNKLYESGTYLMKAYKCGSMYFEEGQLKMDADTLDIMLNNSIYKY